MERLAVVEDGGIARSSGLESDLQAQRFNSTTNEHESTRIKPKVPFFESHLDIVNAERDGDSRGIFATRVALESSSVLLRGEAAAAGTAALRPWRSPRWPIGSGPAR